ncbi:MAG: hypothetical protein A2445_01610 [Candidatus Jacksonbacteria bacterium RIFOXYC2_FULL_44_29]|nr:MAG: Two component transcriptional regulator, winged helix family [Parcubacteria group bacterium GW2011_GWC2_44_22]OGY75073.1 MAG: hypothetical protein A2240_00700 [Candidatus Jacksonbacteria bacterium RIFOXYA2_FULL_43_12]OGY77548.1 MAG: hypothetical protein A2295_05380 [Candidatus Jacksonbacteria bacterium RIFOXYB2_FULL_44_15]OGY79962.1 MAG: hypothetical protein A2550_05485 [Candidatus Jacksonbacteria bacterium RIFOXYD2_FULL_43_21]OGY80350.1 MAG: hypothetical protein A2445_01610 [Candidatus
MAKQTKTILFIEDDPVQQKIYSFAFTKAGYRLLSALDGDTGLDLAEREQPDLILLDLLLNGLSALAGGIETLKKLKANPRTADIPVVIFTNYSKDEVAKSALDLGAREIILKIDVTPHQMVKMMIERYLS